MVEIQVGSKEMVVMVGTVNCKKFNNNNSGEFVVPPLNFTRTQQQIYLNSYYHHSHFLAANLDFFTMAFWGRHPFLQLGCFALDITSVLCGQVQPVWVVNMLVYGTKKCCFHYDNWKGRLHLMK